MIEKTRNVAISDYGTAYPSKLAYGYMGGGQSLGWTNGQLQDNLLYCDTQHKYYANRAYYSNPVNPPVSYEYFRSTQHGRNAWNTCYHDKTCAFSRIFTWLTNQTGFTYKRTGRAGIRPAYNVTGALSSIFHDWSLVSDNLRHEAYWTMRPRFESDVQMFNFIYELKDFKDISKALLKGDRIYRLFNALRVKNFTQVEKGVATGILTKNFMIDPLISDVAKIISQAQVIVKEAQSQFASQGNVPNTRHFSREVSNTFTPKAQLAYSEAYELMSSSGTNAVFTASADYTYKYKCRSGLDAYLQLWGLAPSAEAIWNCIPFSFLADYVISIGHSLSVMRPDNNVVWRIDKYAESLMTSSFWGYVIRKRLSYLLTHQLFVSIDGVTKEITTNDIQSSNFVMGLKRSIFDRRVCNANIGPYLPVFKVPNFKQALNTAALLRVLI